MMGYVERVDLAQLASASFPSCSFDLRTASDICVLGSNDLRARVVDGLLWVSQEAGGPTRNYCANALTGQPLAPIPLPSTLDALLAVGPRVIYVATPPGRGLFQSVAEIPIPTACSLSSTTVAPTTSVPSVASACPASALQISVNGVQGAAGNLAIPILLKNVGPQPCSLFGYPGVSWVTASGDQIGTAAVREPNGSPQTVVLEPGQAGIAVVFAPTSSDQQLAGCTLTQSAGMRIYAPGSFTAVTVTSSDSPNWRAALIWCRNGAATATVQPVGPP
jgi:hypothetical protein